MYKISYYVDTVSIVDCNIIILKYIKFKKNSFTDTMQSTFSSILFIHNYSPSIVISVVGYQASMVITYLSYYFIANKQTRFKLLFDFFIFRYIL